MAFLWWVDDGPLIVVFAWIASPLKIKFKNLKKKIPRQSWTPSDKTFLIRAWGVVGRELKDV